MTVLELALGALGEVISEKETIIHKRRLWLGIAKATSVKVSKEVLRMPAKDLI